MGEPLLRAAPWAGMLALAVLWLQARRGGLEPTVPPEELPALYEAAEPGRGRLARSPLQIPVNGWQDVLWRTWHEIGRDRLMATAAGVTFFTLLAIFPATAAFVSLYGLFFDIDQVGAQLSDLAMFVPASALALIEGQMVRLATARTDALSVAFIVSLFLSVWTANASMNALFLGLNVVYGEREKRNFFLRRMVTYGCTFAALVFASLATAILIAVPIGLKLLGLGETLLVPLRWLLLLGLTACVFAVVYRLGPSRRPARWSWVMIGALGAALAWIIASLGFSWWVNNLANFDATYGPLGTVMVFMMWIWVSIVVVLLGAEFNAEMEHQTARDTTVGGERPIGSRGAAMADSVGPSSGGVRNQARLAWAMVGRQAGSLRRSGQAMLPNGW
jgi:membrane protein